MKEEDLKIEWMNLHVALSYGDSLDINSVYIFSKLRGWEENISAGIGTLCATKIKLLEIF